MEPSLSGQGFFHLVQSVVHANDIVDVVGEHVALKPRGRNFIGLCPFHKEKTPSFNVNPERQIFKCFGCGAGGDAIKFVQQIFNIEFKEALELLARRANIQLESLKGTVKTGQGPSKTEIYKANAWAAEVYSRILWKTPTGEPARNYLAGRKLGREICEQFALGFAPPDGRSLLEAAGRAGVAPAVLGAAGLALTRGNSFSDLFRNRVLFPIHDATGNVIAFGGRTMGDDEPKYLNTPETPVFHKSRSAFGILQGRSVIQESKQVVVVEGYTDVMACHQGGIRNVVATLGTALTEEHVMVLRRYADQIVLIFDGDRAGEKAADRALALFLTMGIDVKVAQLPEGKDPCDLVLGDGPEAFSHAVAAAADALDYKWQQLRRRYDVSATSRERRTAIEELLRTIAVCDPAGKVDAIQRSMVLSRLAGMLSVPVAELAKGLQGFRRQSGHSRQERQEPVQVGLPVPQNSAEAALKELAEVLVCEPGYVGEVRELVDPDAVEPPMLREVYRHLWRAWEEWGEFSLAELIATVEDVALSNVITELHRLGMDRGNFAATVEESLRCIEEWRRDQQASQLAAGLENELSEEEMDRRLAVLQKNMSVPFRRTAGPMVD